MICYMCMHVYRSVMTLIRGHPYVLFPLSYKLSTGISSVKVQKRKPEDMTIHISTQSQHITRYPLEDHLVYFVYVVLVSFVNNVNIVNVEHFHIWSLYIFCNPLLQNTIQVKCLTLYERTSLKVISLYKKKK